MLKKLTKLFAFIITIYWINSIFTGQVFAWTMTVDFETSSGYTVTSWIWNRTTAEKYQWNYSIVADNWWANNSSSCFEISRDTPYNSKISFAYKVSSESWYDFLKFYVDWTEQDKWSGDVTWSEYSATIDSWNHTFKWCYEKDWSVSKWSDTAWVDIFYDKDVIIEKTTILDFETSWWYTVTDWTWNRTTNDKYQWDYSIVADNWWANNSTSCFTRDENFSDTWTLSFYYKVSSEQDYDFLHFYIDWTEQDKWSWNIDWTNYTKQNFPSWDHTLKWCYTKDWSVSKWSDTAWIDIITKEIAKDAIFLDEVTPIWFTNNNTPNYTFSTPITWNISYSGSCDSQTTSTTSTGNITINLSQLPDWTYNDCEIKISNSTDHSEWLPVSQFTIDTTAPTITENIPQNEEVKSWNYKIIINHSDTWWLNLSSANITVNKWLWWDSWTGVTNNVLTNINTSSTWTTADFSWNDWKYRINYSIDDKSWNNSTKQIIFYIDTDTIVDFENTSWYTANSSDWDRETTKVYEWNYSFESKNTSDNSSACFTVDETIPWTWSVDFYYSVSSETNYDFLHFYIDWTQQDKWSWNIDWTHSKTYTFSANKDHELKWCYTKDGSVSKWDDKARIDYIVMQRTDKPTISEVTAITSPTKDNTPDYTFNTSMTWSIAYSGSCDVSWNSTSANSWDNTITFWTLTDGNYNDCEIQVTSSSDSTPWLKVSDFTVDANWPIYNSFSPNTNQIIPKNDFNINISYSDSPSWVDSSTTSIKLYKWDSTNSTWNDISSKLWTWTINDSNASYPTNWLNYWKYKYDFSIKDNIWNQSTLSKIFYIDQPQLIISTWSINIWKLNSSNNTFGDTLTVTVKTIWAPFKVKLKKNKALTHTNNSDFIPYYNWSVWMWYDKNDDGNLSDYNNDIILNDSGTLNTDWNLNIYTYTLKMGAIIDKLQAAWDYSWKIDFGIELNY